MAGSKGSPLLPDVMESQLSTVDLIRAMYPGAEEGDVMESSTQEIIDRVREWCEDPAGTLASPLPRLPSSITFTVTIPLAMEEEEEAETAADQAPPSIEMNVLVPLVTDDDTMTESSPPPPVQYSVRQPPWMSRAEVAELGARLPPGDIFAAFDYVQDHAPRPPKTSSSQNHLDEDENGSNKNNNSTAREKEPLVRVWFYFPSLSTRAKRRDLVAYAPAHGLTGFVLAGKPGVLCVEGAARAVDAYMAAIKNESWGDIPSHQKKVSERFREVIGTAAATGEGGKGGRRFEDMTEITDVLGARHGARKNRGDMAALEAYLKERGVGESFGRVIMGQQHG